ncbi:hypothetical protein DFP72DRAFT_863410 [Ephemerocybe angulata]|uniref:Uncharacterized protein n=1 Tax=Ephemerocybe angulata TaxID=980116 RepID=A0A8H6LSF4_9AGAR|nr:hypothetical protein DFP72DRAFT_863410 [Tulosesus angulatus]
MSCPQCDEGGMSGVGRRRHETTCCDSSKLGCGGLFVVSHGVEWLKDFEQTDKRILLFNLFPHQCPDPPQRQTAQMGKRKQDTTDGPVTRKRAKLMRESAPRQREVAESKVEAVPKMTGTTLPGGMTLRPRPPRAQAQPAVTRKKTQKAKKAPRKVKEDNDRANAAAKAKRSALLEFDWGPESEDEGVFKFDYAKPYEKHSPPPEEEKKPATTINDIPGEILAVIFNELVLQANQNTDPDPLEECNIASPITRVILKARTVLRSVCKRWCEFIDGDSMLWTDIYINGIRIPAQNEYFSSKSLIPKGLDPEEWLGEKYLTEDQNKRLKALAEDKAELAAAATSMARSKYQDVNLILQEPTYHVDHHLPGYITEHWVRDGVLDLIHESLKERKITSLSIRGRNIGFIRQLLDPKLESELEGEGVWRNRRYTMGYQELVASCFSEDADPSLPRIPPLAAGASNEEKIAYEDDLKTISCMDDRRNALAKNLQALRIEEPDWSDRTYYAGDQDWDSDWQRCELPPGTYTSLREVDLTIKHQLCSFALPYAQLTHLRLDTRERDTVIIGILAGCARLTTLKLTLCNNEQTVNDPMPTIVALGHLTSMELLLSGTNILGRLQVPNLEILKVHSSSADCSRSIKEMLQRSECRPRYLYLNLTSTTIIGNAERNMRDMLKFVSTSESLENLTIKSFHIHPSILSDFKPPHLKSLTLVSTWLSYSVILNGCDRRYLGDHQYAAQYGFFVDALSWMRMWMWDASATEKANRRATFVGGLYGTRGAEKRVEWSHHRLVDAIERVGDLGGKVDMSWAEPRVQMLS